MILARGGGEESSHRGSNRVRVEAYSQVEESSQVGGVESGWRHPARESIPARGGRSPARGGRSPARWEESSQGGGVQIPVRKGRGPVNDGSPERGRRPAKDR
jgi:hypothetical protein